MSWYVPLGLFHWVLLSVAMMSIDLDLETICRKLQAEPLFHMSLGSKELFHSNFLAWFITRFPEAAADALGDLTEVTLASSSLRVLREKRDLDLVIELPGRQPIVIENKMFALPDESQLERYTDQAGKEAGHRASLLLLSLTPPGWDNNAYAVGDRIWRYLGYHDLQARLQQQIEAVKSQDRYSGETLVHYCNFIHLLTAFADSVSIQSSSESFELSPKVRDLLQSVRLHDAALKMRAHAVKWELHKRIAHEGINLRAMWLTSGFTNKQSIIEFFMTFRRTSNDEEDAIGWQLQGRQWRLAMVLESLAGRSPEARKRREDVAATSNWFNFGLVEEVLPQAKGTGARTRTFLRFDPSFVYQYRLIPGATVQQIVDLGMSYIHEAIAWGSRRADVAVTEQQLQS